MSDTEAVYLVRTLVAIIDEEMLPGAGNLVIDVGRLNETLIQARQFLEMHEDDGE